MGINHADKLILSLAAITAADEQANPQLSTEQRDMLLTAYNRLVSASDRVNMKDVVERCIDSQLGVTQAGMDRALIIAARCF